MRLTKPCSAQLNFVMLTLECEMGYQNIQILCKWSSNFTGTGSQHSKKTRQDFHMIYLNLWLPGIWATVGIEWAARSAEKYQQKKGEASTTSLNSWCNTSWWFQAIWKISVKMGIFPNFRGEHKNMWNHRLATTLKPKRHIQDRKHHVMLHVILVTNCCAEIINLS